MAERRHLSTVRNAQVTRPSPQEATLEDVDEMSDNWSDEVLACRSGYMSHQFQPYDAIHNKRLHYFLVVLRCPRCTTRKLLEQDDRTGEIFNKWYSYPPGYLAKGKGRIMGAGRNLVRIKALNRLFEIHELSGAALRDDEPRPKTMQRLQGR